MQAFQFLWFERDMADALSLYTSLIPGSSFEWLSPLPATTLSGPPGSVRMASFNLGDQRYRAMETSTDQSHTHAFSIQIDCDTQAEIDRLWDALLDGGKPLACGWLQDRWGVHWQITPRRLIQLMQGPDRDAAKRVTEAMMRMVKLDIAALEAAALGAAMDGAAARPPFLDGASRRSMPDGMGTA